MLRSLFGKLVLVLLGFGAVVAVLSVLVLKFSHETYHFEASQRLNRGLAARLLTESLAPQGGTLHPDAAREKFGQLNRINPDIDLYLLDIGGQVLAASRTGAQFSNARIALPPVHRFLSGDENFPILGDDPREPLHPQIFSAAPVGLPEGKTGYLYVVVHDREQESAARQLKRSYALREGAWAIAGGVIVAALVATLVIAVLTRRLKQLASVMDRFRAGGFTQQPALKVHATGEDEITRLTHAFNDMADRILIQVEELKQTDVSRRELLAGVSHDLRTPLTSLHGHLETLLLKEHELTDKDRRTYLEIAAKQTKRISKLVDRLFELAKLDAREPDLVREPFMLPELLQDVSQKFDLAATEKNVRIDAHFLTDVPLVVGDIGLIERVLDNLVENALRYTPAGGTIDISLTREGEFVVAHVTDTGCGIAKEDLPRIFDRFYRGERNRPAAPDSAGLGLAIVKRILELHGTQVHVESTIGNGTRVSFKLPNHH